MSLSLLHQLNSLSEPVEVIVVGMGFMSFGFLSMVQHTPGIRIPLVITRNPLRTLEQLIKAGFTAELQNDPQLIKEKATQGVISVSDDLELIKSYPNSIVMEMTGTVNYGTEVALATLAAEKHLITMNPELQVAVGAALLPLFTAKNLIVTDVVGDQPGSLARLINTARARGFQPVVAGNMKRYLDVYATQEQMQPWADDKGLAVRQTVSFTDGTKQAIEMTLVANYFNFDIGQDGMHGPVVENFEQTLSSFNFEALPESGVVDYVLGRSLFPGVFIIAKHQDPHQQKYLRYLGLGEGPHYVLFEPYHLCHLELGETILNVAMNNLPTINNSAQPKMTTVTVAKKEMPAGTKLDGIGGDTVYGSIRRLCDVPRALPVGISMGAALRRNVKRDEVISIEDVELPMNAATTLLQLA